jgi:hypothetical protein
MKTISTPLQKRYRFFHEWAGYATPPGKAVCAISLARAEEWAEEHGITAEWENDNDPDLSWWQSDEYCSHCETKRHFSYHRRHGISCRHCSTPLDRDIEVLGCVVRVDEDFPEYHFSLWGITEPTKEYRRVVEAELFAELMAATQDAYIPLAS